MTRFAAFTIVVTLAAAPLAAQRPDRALPEFVVFDGLGAPVSSSAFAPGRRDLMLVVKPDCRPCVQLLRQLVRLEHAGVAQRLVLVVEGSVESSVAFATRELPEELRGARWYADEAGEAWTALDLRGLPVMMGIEGQRIEWTHSGVPARPLLDSIVRTWLASPAGGDR